MRSAVKFGLIALGLAAIAGAFALSDPNRRAGALATVWPGQGQGQGQGQGAPMATGTITPTDTGKSAAPTAEKTEKQGKKPESAVSVEVATARQTTTTSDIAAVGTLQSDESVQVASEIAGRIEKIAFEEGQKVASGAVLLQLDDALAQADLADAKARRSLADANADRTRTLAKSGYATQRSRDEASTTAVTADASLEVAEARLAKHTLKAPFDGIAGLRNVSIGAFVGVGAPLINIEKIDTLKVDFKVPEIYLTAVRPGQSVEVSVDAVPGKTFPGEIYAINPMLDINGRALHVRAKLANPNLLLRPGLFARITIKGLTSREVVVIPESAVVPRGSDAVVYRVDNGTAVEARVALGARRNAEVEVLDGLAASATVVTAGQQKLKNGARVDIVLAAPVSPPAPDVTPANGPAASPAATPAEAAPAKRAKNGRSG